MVHPPPNTSTTTTMMRMMSQILMPLASCVRAGGLADLRFLQQGRPGANADPASLLNGN